MMKRPPQILVRGCAYGDLEGKTMYTIASGKRGPAYLTKWKTLVPLNNSSSSPGGPPPVGSGGGGSVGDQLLIFVKNIVSNVHQYPFLPHPYHQMGPF